MKSIILQHAPFTLFAVGIINVGERLDRATYTLGEKFM